LGVDQPYTRRRMAGPIRLKLPTTEISRVASIRSESVFMVGPTEM
jgi:hypothetical protein